MPQSVNGKGQLSSEVAPCEFFASDARNWRGTLRRLARAGCINLGAPNISDPRLSAGAFCVGKKDGRLRLICDRRARNFREEEVLHNALLPNGSRLCRIVLPKTHAMRFSGRDRKDFYYILGVDTEMHAKQCRGPRVPASWFNSFDDPTLEDSGAYEEWWADDLESISSGAVGTLSPSHFVQPMAMTLVMGDLNAVVAAQETHLGLLDSGGIGANAGDIGGNRFFPWGRGLNNFRWGGPNGGGDSVWCLY